MLGSVLLLVSSSRSRRQTRPAVSFDANSDKLLVRKLILRWFGGCMSLPVCQPSLLASLISAQA